MSDDDIGEELPPLSYFAFWVGVEVDFSVVPGLAARDMIIDDDRAKRAKKDFEAAEKDRLESAAVVARREGRNTSIGNYLHVSPPEQGAVTRADMIFRAVDVRFKEKEPGEMLVVEAARSRHPGTGYEADAQLERASEAHRELVAYRARLDYGSAETAARDKSAARSQYQPRDDYGYEAVR